MKALIGHRGFVGSNLLKIMPNITCLTREELDSRKSLHFDELYIAAPSASKWQVDENPHLDKKNIDSLLRNLTHVSAQRCTLFSTIDVYEADSTVNEMSPVRVGLNYGANRAYFETQLKLLFETVRVRRLGGLFGPGLKKNVIFDAINQRTEYLKGYNPKSEFQYTSIGSALSISLMDRVRDLTILNVVGSPISLEEMLPSHAKYFSNSTDLVKYNVQTLFNFDNHYFLERNQLLSELQAFFSSL